MIRIILAVVSLAVSLCLADGVASYCSTRPTGKYCSSDLLGYYNCNPGGSAYDYCPASTPECKCFEGPACASVPSMVNNPNPCGTHTATPTFNYSPYLSKTDITGTQRSLFAGGSDTTGTAWTYMSSDLHEKRVDTTLAVTDISTNAVTNSQISELYKLQNDGTYKKYTWDIIASTCTVVAVNDLGERVPDGYQILNSTTSSITYYMMTGFSSGNTISLFTTTDYYTVSKTNPVQLINHTTKTFVGFNTNTVSNQVSQFTVVFISDQFFVIPSACAGL